MTILTTVAFCFTTKAEWKLATINDPDGFTNVRSGKGSTFNSLATIKASELFYCEPSSFDWWKVNTMNDVEGYIHKSRIKLIETLPDTSKRALLLSVFQTQKDLAEKFTKAWKSKDSLAYRTTSRNAENHNDNRYTPLLETFTAYFCKTGDRSLLEQLFMTMWAYSGSADERPSYAVGDAFVCKTDLVASLLGQLPKEQRIFIADAIEWGLLNHYNISEDEMPTNKKFIQLKKKLDAARK